MFAASSSCSLMIPHDHVDAAVVDVAVAVAVDVAVGRKKCAAAVATVAVARGFRLIGGVTRL